MQQQIMDRKGAFALWVSDKTGMSPTHPAVGGG